MRALASWCGALAGLLAILIGGLVPAAMYLPVPEPIVLPLPVTWQVPALLLCAMVSGPRAGVMAAVGYLTLGLFSLAAVGALFPVFLYKSRERQRRVLLGLKVSSLGGLMVVFVAQFLSESIPFAQSVASFGSLESCVQTMTDT